VILPLERLADVEGADVDQDPAAVRAQQRDRAPAKAAMADRLAGKTLGQNIEAVHF
jgi:hypothetical protein